MKNSLEGLKDQSEHGEEKISELEDRVMLIIKCEEEK